MGPAATDPESSADGREAAAPSSADPLTPASAGSIGLEALGAPEHARLSVIEEIGRGGMGVVLRVRDEVLRRELAMKRVEAQGTGLSMESSPLSDLGSAPRLVRRLFEEAQITAQLDHSGVVPVHELGVDAEGRPYFTMQRVQGQTLGQIMRLARLEQKGWNLPRVVRVILQVCDTLSYAHAKGVLHRDVKPANVMVGRFGQVYVMDWGLAKVQGRPAGSSTAAAVHTDQSRPEGEGEGLTLHGDIVGTLGYMPIEQARGQPGDLDARADVYAVGATLYQLLAGHPPYLEPERKGPHHEVLRRFLQEDPTPVETLAPEAPPELLAITAKAMARHPTGRFEDMEALAEDLRAWLDGRVVRSHRTGVWVELRKWVARNRALAAGIVGVLGLVLLGGAAFAVQRHQASVEIAKERDAARLAERGAVAARDRALGLRLATEARTLATSRPDAALSLALYAAEKTEGPLVHSALYAALDSHREVLRLRGHETYVSRIGLMPGGTRLVSVDMQGTILFWSLETGQPLRVIEGVPEGVVAADLHVKAGLVAMGLSDGSVRVVRLASGEASQWPTGRDRGVRFLRLSPDGSRMLFADAGSEILFADTWTGEGRTSLTRMRPRRLTVSPRGDLRRRVAIRDGHRAEARGRALVVDVESESILWERDNVPMGSGPIRLDATGERAFLPTHGGEARILDGGDGRHVGTVAEAAHRIIHIHPRDMTSWAAIAQGPTSRHFAFRDRTGSKVHALPAPDLRQIHALSPGGSMALLGIQGFHLLPVGLDAQLTYGYLRGHRYGVADVVWLPDGRVVTASNDETIRVWRLHPPGTSTALAGASSRVRLARRGGRALFQGHDGLSVRDVRTGRTLALFPEPDAARWIGLDALGETVWWVAPSGQLTIGDVATGALHPPVTLEGWPTEPAQQAAWALRVDRTACAHGVRRVAMTFRNASAGPPLGVHVWNADGSLAYAGVSEVRTTNLVMDAAGRMVLVGRGGERTVEVHDVDRQERRHLLEGHTGFQIGLDISDDGRWAATGAVDSSARLWDVERGVEVGRVGGLPMRGHRVLLSPDARTLVVANRPVRIYRIQPSGALVEQGTLATWPRKGLGFTSDNEHLWIEEPDESIRLVPLDPIPLARQVEVESLEARDMAQLDIGTEAERRAVRARWMARPGPWWAAQRIVAHLEAGDLASAEADLLAARKSRPDWPLLDVLEGRLFAHRARTVTGAERSRLQDEALASLTRGLARSAAADTLRLRLTQGPDIAILREVPGVSALLASSDD